MGFGGVFCVFFGVGWVAVWVDLAFFGFVIYVGVCYCDCCFGFGFWVLLGGWGLWFLAGCDYLHFCDLMVGGFVWVVVMVL